MVAIILKERLLKYKNGEPCPNNFTTIDEHNQNINNQTKITKMESKKSYCKPNTFSGSPSESIDGFLKKFQRAASINEWSELE